MGQKRNKNKIIEYARNVTWGRQRFLFSCTVLSLFWRNFSISAYVNLLIGEENQRKKRELSGLS